MKYAIIKSAKKEISRVPITFGIEESAARITVEVHNRDNAKDLWEVEIFDDTPPPVVDEPTADQDPTE